MNLYTSTRSILRVRKLDKVLRELHIMSVMAGWSQHCI